MLNTGDAVNNFDLSTGSYHLLWAYQEDLSGGPLAAFQDTFLFGHGTFERGFSPMTYTFALAAVPAPSSLLLFRTGLAGFVGWPWWNTKPA